MISADSNGWRLVARVSEQSNLDRRCQYTWRRTLLDGQTPEGRSEVGRIWYSARDTLVLLVYFLKRSSKACRASLCRGGAAGKLPPAAGVFCA
jgi:hypothetical protein